MRLINYDGLNIKVADEAFLIRPVRELYSEDKSKDKEDFWRQLSYVWFMCDPRSPYMYITDEDSRAYEIRQQEGLPNDWKPSPTLLRVMEVYRKQSVTTSALLLEDMRKSIDNLRRFLREMDLFATDKNDRPIYQVSSVTTTLKQIPELSRSLAEAEKALAKDLQQDDSARGSVEKAAGEDW